MAFNQGFALIIGIGSYKHIPQANIPISVTDGQEIRNVIQNPNFCGYPPDQVTFLHNDTASREKILAELDALANKTTANNTVFLYYCGHGEYGTDGDYYLTTNDTQASDGKVVKGTGISEVELVDKLRAIPAGKLLLLANSCHSGEISPNLELGVQEKSFGDVSLPKGSTDAILSSGEGRIIITACRPEQKSWIGSGQLSIFTQALVDGLKGEGYVFNNNGYVSAFGLYEHMYFAIKEAADQIGKIQEPELTILRGVGPYPVSLYRGAIDLGIFDTEEPVPMNMAAREVEPTRSEYLYKKYVVQIERMEGGFVVQDMHVEGDVRQAGRDYYEGNE